MAGGNEDTEMSGISPAERWADLDKLLMRPGNLVGPGFEPGPELREFLQVWLRAVCCLMYPFYLRRSVLNGYKDHQLQLVH
jgi:hypothetical protein